MTFSTLLAIETCPLQWSLSRAKYSGIWNRWGYPSRSHVGTVAGEVVHRALERIARAIAFSGDVTVPEPLRWTTILKGLGGYSELLASESRLVAKRSSENPRVTTSDRDLTAELMQRLPAMRQQLQLLSSRLSVPGTAGRTPPTGEFMPRGVSKELRYGLNAEVELHDAAGRWKGMADLIRKSDAGLEIVDFKTGLPSDEHALQLLLYAVLLGADREANPKGLPVTELTVVYAGREESVEIPSKTELANLTAQLNERARNAQAEVSSPPPAARPSPEACSLCAVRQLCETYWTESVLQTVASVAGTRVGLVDAEVLFHEKYAESGWRASVVVCGGLKSGSPVLVRCPRDSQALTTIISGLIRGRILGAQIIQGADEKGEPAVLNLTRITEVFAVEVRSRDEGREG